MKNVTFRQTLTGRMNSLHFLSFRRSQKWLFYQTCCACQRSPCQWQRHSDTCKDCTCRTQAWTSCKMIYNIDIHSMSLLIPTVCIFFWIRVDSLLFGQVSILRNSSHEGYFLTLFWTPWIFTQSPFSTIFLMWLYTETMCATGFLHTKKERTLSLFESVLRCFIKAALSLIELCAFSKAFLFFCM